MRKTDQLGHSSCALPTHDSENPELENYIESLCKQYNNTNPKLGENIHKSQNLNFVNWIQHFKESLKDNVNTQFDFTYMDICIKEQRLDTTPYSMQCSMLRSVRAFVSNTSDLCNIMFGRIMRMRTSDPYTWQYILDGNCCWIMLENGKKVIKWGIIGIASIENAGKYYLQYFITAPIITQMVNECENIGLILCQSIKPSSYRLSQKPFYRVSWQSILKRRGYSNCSSITV